MYYDRTVSPALIDELRPDGRFGYLAELTRKQHLADLQLRGYPTTTRCWATLYVGLTKVLDVHENKGMFRLAGKLSDEAWDPAWAQPHPAAWFDHERIAKYVWGAIGNVDARFTNEGAVQAMLCTRASPLFSVIDREAVVGFTNTAERQAIHNALQDPLVAACVPDAVASWFKPKRFGGELDLLAVDDEGRLLVVEVKPASATSGITWAPFQATFYARLFSAWADEVGPASTAALESMLRQRVELRLTRDPLRPLRQPLEVVPVVAIGGLHDPSKEALKRMWQVQHALLHAGCGSVALEVWRVEETVSRRPLTPNSSTAGAEGP